MSRIGKKPIEIPSGVEAVLKEGSIEVKGALGSRHFDFSEKLKVDIVESRSQVVASTFRMSSGTSVVPFC